MFADIAIRQRELLDDLQSEKEYCEKLLEELKYKTFYKYGNVTVDFKH